MGPNVHAGDRRRTGTRILTDAGEGSSFLSAIQLAASAGLAPATRSSGSSSRCEQLSQRENKQLKPGFLRLRFRDPGWPRLAHALRQKKRQSEHHTQTLPDSSAFPGDEPTCSSPRSATAPSAPFPTTTASANPTPKRCRTGDVEDPSKPSGILSASLEVFPGIHLAVKTAFRIYSLSLSTGEVRAALAPQLSAVVRDQRRKGNLV
ncbi:transposase [Streptomyces sp. 900105245]